MICQIGREDKDWLEITDEHKILFIMLFHLLRLSWAKLVRRVMKCEEQVPIAEILLYRVHLFLISLPGIVR